MVGMMGSDGATTLDNIISVRRAWHDSLGAEVDALNGGEDVETCKKLCGAVDATELRRLHCRRHADNYPRPTMHRSCFSGMERNLLTYSCMAACSDRNVCRVSPRKPVPGEDSSPRHIFLGLSKELGEKASAEANRTNDAFADLRSDEAAALEASLAELESEEEREAMRRAAARRAKRRAARRVAEDVRSGATRTEDGGVRGKGVLQSGGRTFAGLPPRSGSGSARGDGTMSSSDERESAWSPVMEEHMEDLSSSLLPFLRELNLDQDLQNTAKEVCTHFVDSLTATQSIRKNIEDACHYGANGALAAGCDVAETFFFAASDQKRTLVAEVNADGTMNTHRTQANEPSAAELEEQQRQKELEEQQRQQEEQQRQKEEQQRQKELEEQRQKEEQERKERQEHQRMLRAREQEQRERQAEEQKQQEKAQKEYVQQQVNEQRAAEAEHAAKTAPLDEGPRDTLGF